MRLLAGVTMDEADVTTVRKGHKLAEILKDKLLPLLDIKDPLIKRPLEVLAWMAANENPADPAGFAPKKRENPFRVRCQGL